MKSSFFRKARDIIAKRGSLSSMCSYQRSTSSRGKIRIYMEYRKEAHRIHRAERTIQQELRRAPKVIFLRGGGLKKFCERESHKKERGRTYYTLPEAGRVSSLVTVGLIAHHKKK